MRVIAIEEHMFPRDLVAAAGLDLGPRAGLRADELDDCGAARLAMMDAAGVDMQILSLALGNTIQELAPERSVMFAQTINDRLAEIVAAHPQRFGAFAALPMSAPEQAAEELERAVADLGHLGAMIYGQTRGVFVDDPSVRPVLAAAERLSVPIYLHPAPPPAAVAEAYFSGLAPDRSLALATAGWGWHAECGMHVLRMVLGGVFERFPSLQIIVGHMGENLPFSLHRADEMIGAAMRNASSGVAETVLRHVHISTCGYHTDAPLQCALDVFGADRIMFSVDHPFGHSARATAFLRDASVSPADRDKIAHANAERLLRLS
jgi:uncharacterized protein